MEVRIHEKKRREFSSRREIQSNQWFGGGIECL